MDNSKENEILDTPNPPPQYEQHFVHTLSPFAVIALCFGLFLAGNMVAGLIMIGLAKVSGLDITALMKGLSENTPVGTRNFMRLVLFINHIFSFILPAFITAWIAYKRQWFSYFKLDNFPKFSTIGLAFVWLLASMPVVQYAYQVNKMLQLPQWMMDMENSTSGMLEAIISKENFYEIIINVFLIAIIPAIGEELMFRGVIQQQIGRLFKNEHVQVWLSAAIFSAIHMQFQGFLARMILGALLGYLLVWTRSLWLPMIFHFLNNGLQVVGLYVMNVKPSDMDKIGPTDKIDWTIAGVFLMVVLALGKYIRENNLPPPEPNALDEVV